LPVSEKEGSQPAVGFTAYLGVLDFRESGVGLFGVQSELAWGFGTPEVRPAPAIGSDPRGELLIAGRQNESLVPLQKLQAVHSDLRLP
jgi:hypothetical protein